MELFCPYCGEKTQFIAGVHVSESWLVSNDGEFTEPVDNGNNNVIRGPFGFECANCQMPAVDLDKSYKVAIAAYRKYYKKCNPLPDCAIKEKLLSQDICEVEREALASLLKRKRRR